MPDPTPYPPEELAKVIEELKRGHERVVPISCSCTLRSTCPLHIVWHRLPRLIASLEAATRRVGELEKIVQRVSALDPYCPKPIGMEGSVMRQRQELANDARAILVADALSTLPSPPTETKEN